MFPTGLVFLISDRDYLKNAKREKHLGFIGSKQDKAEEYCILKKLFTL
jgi:hypothetical protein